MGIFKSPSETIHVLIEKSLERSNGKSPKRLRKASQGISYQAKKQSYYPASSGSLFTSPYPRHKLPMITAADSITHNAPLAPLFK